MSELGVKSSRSSAWLFSHQSDTYSQAGEDGVIAKVLELLPARDRWCVEFGAWDGHHLSNTRRLIEAEGYSAVLIEGDPRRFAGLQAAYASNANIHTLHGFVGFEAADNLDHILSRTPIPQDFDFLSIDIDGNDYHVWKAMAAYRPKIVCIEFNPTIPSDVEFVQEPDPKANHGSSVSALVALGKQKGYELICLLSYNAFFCRAEDFQLFGITDNSVRTLRKDTQHVAYLFHGFDGTVFLRGSPYMIWHGRMLRESRLQHFPKFLRRFPDNYNLLQRIAFRVLAHLGRI